MTLEIRDGDGVEKHIRTLGVGSEADPYRNFTVGYSYLDAVGAGEVSGACQFNSYGAADLSAGNGHDVWEGPTTTQPIPPDGGIQMQLVSSSAQDSAAGTGIRTVNLHLVLEDGSEYEEVVTLNGVTPVNTVKTDIRWCNRMHAATVGSTGSAVGDVTMESVGGATVYHQISATGNQTLSCAKMVPGGKVLYINSFAASQSATTKTSIRLRSTSDNGDLYPGVFLFKSAINLRQSAQTIPFSPPISIPAMAIVKVSNWSEGASEVAANWSGWLQNV